jgi:hypothetical protein
MMTKITPNLLNDTYNLVQLARETARIQGQQTKADRLTPLVDGLRGLVSEAKESKPAPVTSDMMAQSDFQTLLKAVQTTSKTPDQSVSAYTSSKADRNQVMLAMASGGMTDVDIARQMGMTRDEVRLVMSIHRPQSGTTEVSK